MPVCFDVRQELPGFESLPGQVPEIDTSTRHILARVILDETVELMTYNRGSSVRYGELDDTEFAELFRPLVDVLELDPATDPPPLRTSIDRASILGLVPNQKTIYERTTLSKVQAHFGFRPKFRFQDWLKADYVEAGQHLASIVGGRPTRFDIAAAGRGEFRRLGDFPTVNEIQGRFGRLAVFHELIGYPSCNGWAEEDYFDWADAFYRQNPDKAITARRLNRLSAAGVGPSRQAIYAHFGSLSKFQDLSRQYHEAMSDDEERARQQRLSQTEELVRYEPTLAEALAEADQRQQRILQVAAQFRLAKHLLLNVSPAELRDRALIKSPDVFTRSCLQRSNGGFRAADVETTASAFGVFDDMWPMHRFGSVNLRVDSK